MWMIPFLICFPLVIAALMFVIRNEKIRGIVAYVGAGTIMAVTGIFAFQWFAAGAPLMELYYHTHTIDMIMLGGVWLLMFVITYLSFKYRKQIISLLSIIPTLMVTYMELFGPEMAEIAHIRVDKLSMKCPKEAIVVDRAEKTWTLNKDLCVSCGLCESSCPKKCISMVEDK